MSTATPAINAWLNPTHRAAVSAQNLVTQLEHRVVTVMACMMVDGLDLQKLHALTRVRIDTVYMRLPFYRALACTCRSPF